MNNQATHNGAVRHCQKISDPDGMAYSVSLSGEEITLSDPNGREFYFSAQLIPEFVGTFYDMDKVYGRGL